MPDSAPHPISGAELAPRPETPWGVCRQLVEVAPEGSSTRQLPPWAGPTLSGRGCVPLGGQAILWGGAVLSTAGC